MPGSGENRFAEIRLVFQPENCDAADVAARPLQMLGGKVAGIRREDSDAVIRSQGPLNEGQLQQAGGKDRYRKLPGEFLLKEDHESTGGGKGLYPLPYQFPPGLDERSQQGGVPIADQPFQGGPVDFAATYGEGKGGGVSDIPRNTFNAGIHHQDSDHGLLRLPNWYIILLAFSSRFCNCRPLTNLQSLLSDAANTTASCGTAGFE